jgi:kumamolisin
MTNGAKRALPDSAPQPPVGVRAVGTVDPGQHIVVSVYLKAAPAEPPIDLETLTARRAIELADDIEELGRFAAQHGLTVESVEPARRLVQLSGSVPQVEAAFGVSLQAYVGDKGRFFSHREPIQAPERLADRIESVLGLDTRPIGEPQAALASNSTPGYLPNKISALYGFPSQVDGAGQCIGIIEFGGGYRDSDNRAAFSAMGLPVPEIVSVSVDGARNNPGNNDADDQEVALDIQVAGGCAPRAKIVVYFAPRTQGGWINAISRAVNDFSTQPSVISISWGQVEDDWAHWWRFGVMDSVNSALRDAAGLGISVFVADGDHLATDGSSIKANAYFPASSPWAIGCGGTRIFTSGNVLGAEMVWNEGLNGWGTGGGVSDYFDVPSFQASTKLPPSVNDGRRRRGVPDVAGNASLESPYQIILDGKPNKIGGTSAVAPLWAGLTARLNQAQGFPLGFFLPTLYSGQGSGLRGITAGNNRPIGSRLGYDAGPGWNACTGFGVPTSGVEPFLVRLVSASSRLAAVNYGGDRNISNPAPRLYYQDKRSTIREYCQIAESVWRPGASFGQALDGSAIAAISSKSRDKLYHRVYFQTAAGEIQEYCHDGESWRAGATLAFAVAQTPLAAVAWGYSSPHIRVYYI